MPYYMKLSWGSQERIKQTLVSKECCVLKGVYLPASPELDVALQEIAKRSSFQEELRSKDDRPLIALFYQTT